MADQSAILREYLVALGFVVDESGAKKVDGTITKMDKRVTNLAKGIIGVAAATQAMVTAFAYQMEKLYYSSQRAEASADKLASVDYAWRQLGGAGGAMKGAIEGMASALRQNPGLVAMLENLGIRTQGRDRVEVMNDFLRTLKAMPPYIAAQYAKMFGIDESTLRTLTENLDQFEAFQKQRSDMAKELGVDMKEASEAGKVYAQTLREMWERVGILSDALSIKLLPAFQETATIINMVLGDLTKLVVQFKSWDDLWSRFKEGITGNVGGGVQLSADAKARLAAAGIEVKEPHKPKNWWQRMMDAKNEVFGKKAPAAAPPPPQVPAIPTSAPASLEEKQAYLASLEQKYGLPPGWLDRVWKKESNRGDPRFMRSKVGAKGHFQFMDPTARQYGLDNPDDFQSSADAAGRYYRDLGRRYKGDWTKAAAAYNWGMGNVERKGLGAMPAETRGYVDAVAGPTIYQNNPITISGVSDPEKAGQFAADAQKRANADLIRDLKPSVR